MLRILWKFSFECGVRVVFSPEHIGVRTETAELRSDLVDQQNIDKLERQPKEEAARMMQHGAFLFDKILWQYRLDASRVLLAILQDHQPGQEIGFVQHDLIDAAGDIVKRPAFRCPMIMLRAIQVSESQCKHFENPALYIAMKDGVQLHAVTTTV